jgi:hypothetical protein
MRLISWTLRSGSEHRYENTVYIQAVPISKQEHLHVQRLNTVHKET